MHYPAIAAIVADECKKRGINVRLGAMLNANLCVQTFACTSAPHGRPMQHTSNQRQHGPFVNHKPADVLSYSLAAQQLGSRQLMHGHAVVTALCNTVDVDCCVCACAAAAVCSL